MNDTESLGVAEASVQNAAPIGTEMLGAQVLPDTSDLEAPRNGGTAAPGESEFGIAAHVNTPAPTELPRASARYIWLLVLSEFGVFMAFITPLALSLSIKVNALAPGHVEYLGYISGLGALVPLVTGPVLGSMSDRTRTRWGRRRPWILGGTLLGLVSLVVMAAAPSITVLALGWMLAQLGWGQALGNIGMTMADRLPESQRGKVAGMTGFATQIAPVAGIVIVGRLVTLPMFMFLVPGIIGGLLAGAFVAFVREEDSRGLPVQGRMNLKAIFATFVFNPRAVPDYSLMWLSRLCFYFSLTMSTTYTTFFFASRLNIPLTSVAGVIATISSMGVVTTSVGALGGGFVSDKLKRRRVMVLVGGILLAAGAVVQSQAHSLPLLVVGSLTGSLGLGLFAAVDQALMIDVIPDISQTGRFMSIAGLATSLGQSVAPFVAPALILTAANGAKNYTILYISAGVMSLLAGVLAMRIRSVR